MDNLFTLTLFIYNCIIYFGRRKKWNEWNYFKWWWVMKKYKLKSNIWELIEKSGLRNDYIRKHVNVQQKQLWNWKNGVSFPTLEKAFILAKIVGYKVDDLAELVEVEEEE